MDVSQMNKTAILSFILDEVVVKCRNVSSNMRKRMHWMLKERKITVNKYDERVLELNGWIALGKGGVEISKLEEIKKGVFNYELNSQEQLERVMSLNNEVRCFGFDFILTEPVEVESIEDFTVERDNYEICSKSFFTKAKHLSLLDLSTDQIKFIITRFKNIEKLQIDDYPIGSIDFSESRIRQFSFAWASFTEPLYLPSQIDQLDLRECESSHLIKARRVKIINFMAEDTDSKEYVTLAKTLKGVKFAAINKPLEECLTRLPSTLRKINSIASSLTVDNSEQIFKQFPYLIETDNSFPIEGLENTKVRIIDPIMTRTRKKFNLRPRKIRIASNNVVELNNHPELFEKVESVYIDTNKFNFEVLPNEIKKIQIREEANEQSRFLNRL